MPDTLLPISVYLDHNILNDIAPAGKDWQTTEWGKYLLDQTRQGSVAVYASPANCFEIALTKDLDHRNNMARALNTLIAGQRMLPSYEVFMVENLFRHVAAHWPNSVNLDALSRLKHRSSLTYIALLGQLAALREYECTKGLASILKPKIITQIIQGTILENPQVELKKRLAGLTSKDLRPHDAFAEYDTKSLEELTTSQQAIRAKSYTVDKTAVKFLKTNKAAFVQGYGLDELRSSIHEVLSNREDLWACVPGLEQIVRDWSKVYGHEPQTSGFTPPPLPAPVVAAFAARKPTFGDCFAVLNAVGTRFFPFLTLPHIYASALFNEMEQTLNNAKLPNVGLTIDCQHSIACAMTNFFLVRDDILAGTVKQWHGKIAAESDQEPESAKTLSEFQRKLEKRLQKRKSA